MPTAKDKWKSLDPIDIYGYFLFLAKSPANLLTNLGQVSANLCRWAVTISVRTG
jgi:hypothetical protein